MIRRLTRLAMLVMLVPIGLYLIAAAAFSRIPVNAGWREPAEGITIFIQTNGVHTGIVLPDGPGRWRAFGWGDRDFYLNTPTWQHVRIATVLAALIGSGNTLIHVDRLRDFRPDASWRPMRVRPAEYARLATFIAATRGPGGKAIPGYGSDDNFYAARGHYSALRTCNVWVSEALGGAGIKTGLWTPFSDGVMRWVNLPKA